MSSSIPAAIDWLLAGCRAAATGAQVIDGQPLSTQNDYIAIGFTQNPDSSAVAKTQSTFTAGFARELESYDIYGEVSSWSGDTNQKAARDRAFALMGYVEGVVAADRKFGGAVMQAQLVTGDLIQALAGEGAVATIPFTVHVQAQQ